MGRPHLSFMLLALYSRLRFTSFVAYKHAVSMNEQSGAVSKWISN